MRLDQVSVRRNISFTAAVNFKLSYLPRRGPRSRSGILALELQRHRAAQESRGRVHGPPASLTFRPDGLDLVLEWQCIKGC